MSVFGEVSINMVVNNKAEKHIENHLRTYRKHSLIFTNQIQILFTLDPGSGIGFGTADRLLEKKLTGSQFH